MDWEPGDGRERGPIDWERMDDDADDTAFREALSRFHRTFNRDSVDLTQYDFNLLKLYRTVRELGGGFNTVDWDAVAEAFDTDNPPSARGLRSAYSAVLLKYHRYRSVLHQTTRNKIPIYACHETTFTGTIEAYTTDEGYEIFVLLPGINDGDVDVQYTDDGYVHIKGYPCDYGDLFGVHKVDTSIYIGGKGGEGDAAYDATIARHYFTGAGGKGHVGAFDADTASHISYGSGKILITLPYAEG